MRSDRSKREEGGGRKDNVIDWAYANITILKNQSKRENN